MASVEMRAVRPEDEAELGRFAAALPAGDPARTVIADWERYAGAHPSGLRVWVAATSADHRGPARFAALVAARPVPARVDGQERTFAEFLAASAHPADRGTARAPRLVAELTRRHLAATNTLEHDLVAYGSASDDAWRLLRHDLGVEILRRQPELVLELGADAAPDDVPDGVREVAAFDGRVLALYERCAAAWRASALRDEATLAWRFPAGGGSRRLVVEDGAGGLAGVAVAAGRAGRLEVLDWLVPESNEDAGRLLVAALGALARREGLREVRAGLPPWSPDFARFQTAGFRVQPTADFVLARSAHAKLDVWWLREHWWFQPFDVVRLA